jgi:hypothetical protein
MRNHEADMTDQNKRPAETFDWRGSTVSVTYEPNWLGLTTTVHLDIEAIAPEGAVLPITETGYRSQFSDEATVAEGGGPVAFVRAWLDQAAQSKRWKVAEAEGRQLKLF